MFVPAVKMTFPDSVLFMVVTPPLLPPVDPDTPMTTLFPDVYREILVPAVKVTTPHSEFIDATPAATPPL